MNTFLYISRNLQVNALITLSRRNKFIFISAPFSLILCINNAKLKSFPIVHFKFENILSQKT